MACTIVLEESELRSLVPVDWESARFQISMSREPLYSLVPVAPFNVMPVLSSYSTIQGHSSESDSSFCLSQS